MLARQDGSATVVAPTPEMWQSVISSRYDTHPARKPPYTLIELIGMAILAHDEQAPTVGEIYEWVSNKFLYYNQGDTGWKNSIRHTLSIKDHFIQAGHPQPSIAGGGRTGRKSKTWKIDHRFRDHFRLEQAVEDGVTVWKLKYVPSKISTKLSPPSMDNGAARSALMRDIVPRKAGNKVRKSTSMAHKQRLNSVLDAVGSGLSPLPSMMPLSSTAPIGGDNGAGVGAIHPYLYSQSPLPDDDRGLINFPSVEDVAQSELYDDHDDQKLVYLPRYDKRPRRKASLAACDVLTSLSTRIQSSYQMPALITE